MVSICILSNTLGEQYSIKNSKMIQQVIILLYVVHPGQLRGLSKHFYDVVNKVPEKMTSVNFHLTWNLKKHICTDVPWDHPTANEVVIFLLWVITFVLTGNIIFLIAEALLDLNLFWAFCASLGSAALQVVSWLF